MEKHGRTARSHGLYATTSAELKLLRLRLTLLNPGLSDFVPGLTTALELVFIQASGVPLFAQPFPFSVEVTPFALLARRPLAASVGRREAAGACKRARVAIDVVLRVAGGGLARI